MSFKKKCGGGKNNNFKKAFQKAKQGNLNTNGNNPKVNKVPKRFTQR